MNKILLLSALILAISLSSCSKCDPSNSIGGIVVEDAIVRIIGKAPIEAFITDQTSFDKAIEVSFDEGVNYKNVDFSKYSVFALTTTARCSSGYNRNVKVNKADATVTYTVTITECSTCQNNTTIANYVLTEAVPDNYTPIFKIERN